MQARFPSKMAGRLAATLGLFGMLVMLAACGGGGGSGSGGGSGTGTTHGTGPTAPSNLVATAPSTTQVNLTWTASTGSAGIASYQVFRDGNGAALAQPTGTLYSDTSVVAGTSYTYVVKAVDTSGNTSPASNTASVTTPAATTPEQPTISITSPSATGIYTTTASTVSVSGTTSDSVEVTTVTWANSTNNTGGTATGTTTWSIPSITLATGPNIVSITASDPSGLTASTKITIIYAPAATPPSITIAAPSASGAYASTTSTVAISGTASDPAGVTSVTWTNKQGGSGTATGTTTWSIPAVALRAGANVVIVTAHDAAGGLTAAATITITYTPSGSGPSIAITSPSASGNYGTANSTIAVSGSASAGVTQVSWTNSANGSSGTAAGTTSWSVASITLVSGSNVVTVTATAAGGLTSTARITILYTQGATAPTISITSPSTPPNYTSFIPVVSVAGVAKDSVGITQINWTCNNCSGATSGIASGASGWAIPAGATPWEASSLVLSAGPNTITVTAYNGAQLTASATITITYTPVTSTGGPTLAGVTGQGTAILTWTPVNGATQYKVYRATSPAANGIVNSSNAGTLLPILSTTPSSPFTDMGLASNCNSPTATAPVWSNYYYVITAVTGAGTTPYSNQIMVTPNCLVPSAPDNFDVTAGDGVTNLSWTERTLDITQASSWLIYRNGVFLTTTTQSSYTDNAVTNGTSYTYFVAGVSSVGQSPNSTQLNVTPQATIAVPPAPTGVKAMAAGSGEVALYWNPAAGATSYQVHRGTTVITCPVPSPQAPCSDTGLTNGTTYTYTVYAINGSGMSASSLPSLATPSNVAPPAPTGLAATAQNQYVTLAWNAVTTATGYNVYRSSSGVASTLMGAALINSYVDNGLTNDNGAYTYTVTATNSIGEGVRSSPTSATPSASIIPAAGSYVKPYSVGFLGDPATLTEYNPTNGFVVPGCDTTWQPSGMRCDQTNLVLDHVHISGGPIYWTGGGNLTISNSIIESSGLGLGGIQAHACAGCSPYATLPNSTITVTNSTLRYDLGQAMPPSQDTWAIFTPGDQAIVVIRNDMSGLPQGVKPAANSIVDSNFIHNLLQDYSTSGCTAQSSAANPCDAHMDGIFSEGGNNLIVQRNYTDAPLRFDTTSPLFFQSSPPITNVSVYANFLNGGSFTFANQDGAGVNVQNNTFGSGVYGYAYGPSPESPDASYTTWSGNVFTDGSTVPNPLP
jgi:fibronectin type 3 domain-containing protein